MSDVTLQPEGVKDLLKENARRVKAEGEHPELFAIDRGAKGGIVGTVEQE